MGSTATAPKSFAEHNKIIWFMGVPTAGKSWVCDFMETYHDCIHLDGDEVLMRMDPANIKQWGGIWDAFGAILTNQPAPQGSMEPYIA